MQSNRAHAEIGTSQVDRQIDALLLLAWLQHSSSPYLFSAIGNGGDICWDLTQWCALLLQTFFHLTDEFLNTLVDIFGSILELRNNALGLCFKSHVGQGVGCRKVGGEHRLGLALRTGF